MEAIEIEKEVLPFVQKYHMIGISDGRGTDER